MDLTLPPYSEEEALVHEVRKKHENVHQSVIHPTPPVTPAAMSQSNPSTNILELIREPNDILANVTNHLDQEIRSGCASSVNKKGWHGETAIHFACVSGNLPLMRLLLARGADVSTSNNAGEGLFHVLCQSGRIDMIRVLLNHMDRGREVLLRARDVRGMTPMMHAALRGQIKVMHYLHSTHEHPYHDIDRDGRGLLHCAAEMGHVLTVRYLLRNERVDPSFKTNDGRTALHIAAYHCYPDVCRVLLRNNIAELGVCDKSGKDAHGFVAKQESITKRYNQIITMNVLNYAECCTDEGDISTPTLLSFREKVILNVYLPCIIYLSIAMFCYAPVYLRLPLCIIVALLGHIYLLKPYNRTVGPNPALLKGVWALLVLVGWVIMVTIFSEIGSVYILLCTSLLVVYGVYVWLLTVVSSRMLVKDGIFKTPPSVHLHVHCVHANTCDQSGGPNIFVNNVSSLNAVDGGSGSQSQYLPTNNSVVTKVIEEPYDQFCVTCEDFRLLGTKHCTDCDICVPGFDHHCRWLNCDIGAHNHLAFCTFLAVGGLLGVLYTAAFIACLLHQYEEFEVVNTLSNAYIIHPLALFMLMIAVGAAYMQWMMLYTQVHQIANGVTTKDVVIAMRYGLPLNVRRSNTLRLEALSNFFFGPTSHPDKPPAITANCMA